MTGNTFTHFDSQGNAVMVDVTDKAVTLREATAKGFIKVSEEVLQAIENRTASKGDVLGVARVAAIMGAKRTAELIPLCHPLMLSECTVNFSISEDEGRIWAQCRVRTAGATGVEMEALTGVSVALLTVYDMCKAVDKTMEIGGIYLCEKTGGKSGHFLRDK